MKTKPEDDPRTALASVPDATRLLHTNILALRENLKKLSKEVTGRVHSAYRTENPFSVSNMGSAMTSIAQSDFAIEFATTEAMLRTLENSAEFKAADAVISPLLLAVARLEVWEQTEREDANRRKTAFDAARDAARKRALEQAEKDPAVLAAKRDFESASSAK
jgi:hypothetical protein